MIKIKIIKAGSPEGLEEAVNSLLARRKGISVRGYVFDSHTSQYTAMLIAEEGFPEEETSLPQEFTFEERRRMERENLRLLERRYNREKALEYSGLSEEEGRRLLKE